MPDISIIITILLTLLNLGVSVGLVLLYNRVTGLNAIVTSLTNNHITTISEQLIRIEAKLDAHLLYHLENKL